MCRELFAEGQLIHVDHDHECCRVKNRSCGKCVRGLLCHGSNIALDHIEHRYAPIFLLSFVVPSPALSLHRE